MEEQFYSETSLLTRNVQEFLPAILQQLTAIINGNFTHTLGLPAAKIVPLNLAFQNLKQNLKKQSERVGALENTNTSLKQAYDEMTNLIHLSDIVSETKLDNILELLIDLISRIITCHSVILFSYDHEANWEPIFTFKCPSEYEFKVKKNLKDVFQWIIDTGEIVILPSEEYSEMNDLLIPLKVVNREIGIIYINTPTQGEEITQLQKTILKVLSGQAAVAIENSRLYNELHELFLNTVQSLAAAVDARDPYTHGHSQRVAEYSLLTGTYLKLDSVQLHHLKLSALLHDIGKIGVPDNVLRKKGKLNDEEYKQIMQHPIIGVNIITPVDKLKEIIPGIKHHHERWDGKGYPDRLKANDIPLFGRIIAIADTFDAMMSNRIYRNNFTFNDTIAEIRHCAGTQFDPELAKIFIEFIKRKKLEVA